MCEYCKKHANKLLTSNRWYLNPECYSEDISMTRDRISVYNKIIGYTGEYYFDFTNRVLRFQKNTRIPLLGRIIRAYTRREAPNLHAGQIVSLEDTLRIVDLSDKHVLLPCACRSHSGGYEEFTCLNFGVIKDLVEKAAPDLPTEDVTRAEAKKLLEEWDQRGYYHQTLWAKQPYIVCICNCDARSCVPHKQRLVFDIPYSLTKGHEIAKRDPELCDGCLGRPACTGRCSFNAIKYDHYKKIVAVDPMKCFGCGVCRTACDRDALSLIPREKML
ncbi:MAG: ATP-binding protein, partial [Promethearchaeota archaeon]